jgi:alpha-N-arabinofuranosidase
MKFNAKTPNEKAGLLIFQSEYHFYYLCKSVKDNKAVVQLYKGNAASKNMDLLAEKEINENLKQLYFKINVNGGTCDFYFAEQAEKWQLLKDKVDGKYLSTQEAGGFIGSLFAMYATSSGMPTKNTASFKWLDYMGNDPIYKLIAPNLQVKTVRSTHGFYHCNSSICLMR